MVSTLFKKRKRSPNKTQTKTKKSEELQKVLNGFVKSSNGLEGTIEESKKSDSSASESSDNSSSTDKNEKKATGSGITFTIIILIGVPFRRIQDDVWLNKIEKEELKANSYKMKNDTFALKAAEELGSVKGKDFKSQKYKKKRSSWSGSGNFKLKIIQFR